MLLHENLVFTKLVKDALKMSFSVQYSSTNLLSVVLVYAAYYCIGSGMDGKFGKLLF